MVFDAFVDAKKVLRLGGVIDRYAWPCSNLAIVNVFRRLNTVESLLNGTAANHLLYARRDDVVLQI